jgi:preprotein translocase subunit SecE
MKKQKVKPKGQRKETGANTSRGQVVRLKSAKTRTSWTARMPSVTNWWHQIVTFVAEAWQELKKVTWPGRKETLGTTLVVLILVVFIAAFLGMVDMGLSTLVNKIIRVRG